MVVSVTSYRGSFGSLGSYSKKKKTQTNLLFLIPVLVLNVFLYGTCEL